jgi:pantoate--beta-alanine ligase
MTICRTIEEMRAQVRDWRQAGLRVGLVPTMGYLHEGHMSLVDLAAQRAERVVLSIYVNPTQFGPGEDLDKYPRDFARDEALCRQRGVQALFYPESRAMYAPSHSTWVVVEGLTETLCGRSRPGHFRGVSTVVTKLFNIVQPDVAVFGRKDAQQVLVIQRLVRDLDQPVEVVVAPIVREADGLAMSSRNTYLSADERRRAVCISQALQDAADGYAGGELDACRLRAGVTARIQAGGGRVDYVECVSRDTLQAVTRVDQPALLAVAAFFGKTRLIDNVYLG